MGKKSKRKPTKRNPIARVLKDPIFKPRIVPVKRKPPPNVGDYDE